MVAAGYKQTEVGVIPEDWEIRAISEVSSRVGDGIHSTPTYSNTGKISFINGNNLVASKISESGCKKISYNEYLIHKQILGHKCLLMSINGTIGNVAYYNQERVLLGKSVCYINTNSLVCYG